VVLFAPQLNQKPPLLALLFLALLLHGFLEAQTFQRRVRGSGERVITRRGVPSGFVGEGVFEKVTPRCGVQVLLKLGFPPTVELQDTLNHQGSSVEAAWNPFERLHLRHIVKFVFKLRWAGRCHFSGSSVHEEVAALLRVVAAAPFCLLLVLLRV